MDERFVIKPFIFANFEEELERNPPPSKKKKSNKEKRSHKSTEVAGGGHINDTFRARGRRKELRKSSRDTDKRIK